LSSREIDEVVLEEGCYYLRELGLSSSQVAKNFAITRKQVESLAASYQSKLLSGVVIADPFDRTFCEDVKKEAEGDFKVTFISERGVHHGWKSDLGRMDGPSLMAIFEASQDFLNADPNQRFLEFKPPSGYDPLALEREVKKSISVISEILHQKGKESSPSG